MTDQPSPTLADTQPRRPLPIDRWRALGCWAKGLVALAILLLIPVFLCGLTLVVYVVFPPPPVDILVLGLDAREGEGFATRTDTIMLLGVDPRRLRVNLLSIPRDLFLDVPGYGMQRINTVNMLGEVEQPGRGPALVSSAIAQSFGVEVDRYVRLDFHMFVALVDSVGGISVYVDRVIEDDAYPTGQGGEVMSVRFESGWQTMDGKRALIYARVRHGDDDYRRAERQQQVVGALAKALLNPANWPAVVSVIRQSIDTDLNLWDMVTIAPPVLLNAGRFDQLVINRDYIAGTAEGFAIPNYELLAPWLEGRFN